MGNPQCERGRMFGIYSVWDMITFEFVAAAAAAAAAGGGVATA